MHDCGFGLIGHRQVHAVYTTHMCRTMSRYNMACDKKVARLVMEGLDSPLQSAILHLVLSCNVARLVIDLHHVKQSVNLVG